jgi:hypothetical protein
MEALIERLRSLAFDPNRATDQGRHGAHPTGPDGKLLKLIAAAPLSRDKIANVEQSLGITLPRLVVSLYSQIGNGGFGPGHGILPLIPPELVPSYLDAAFDLYQELNWSPTGSAVSAATSNLLPFCEWGSGQFSCLLLDDHCCDDASLVRLNEGWDENTTRMISREGNYRAPGLIFESSSLQDWLSDWIDGADLFGRPFRTSA